MSYKIVNNNKKFLYVHIPKTGGTTIEDTLDKTSWSIVGHLSLKDIKKRFNFLINYIKNHIHLKLWLRTTLRCTNLSDS